MEEPPLVLVIGSEEHNAEELVKCKLSSFFLLPSRTNLTFQSSMSGTTKYYTAVLYFFDSNRRR